MKNLFLALTVVLTIAVGAFCAGGNEPFQPAGLEIASGNGQERCGILALYQVVRQIAPSNPEVDGLLAFQAPEGGFSLLELSRIGASAGVIMHPIERLAGNDVPVPSVAHLGNDHFVAVLEKDGQRLRVYDPAADRLLWITEDRLNAATSGAFLAIPPSLGPDWALLSEAKAHQIRGSSIYDGTAPLDDENEDCPNNEFLTEPKCPTDDCEECPTGENSAQEGDCDGCGQAQSAPTAGNTPHGGGVPVWKVSEPTINLWINDKPLYYTTSHDDWLVFKMNYKQRNPEYSTNIFGLGKNWESNWRTWMEPAGAANKIRMAVAGGGWRVYEYDVIHPPSMTTASSINGGTTVNVSFAHGGLKVYKAIWTPSTNVFHFPETVTDKSGRQFKFEYEVTSDLVRLLRLVDSDNKTNYVSYDDEDRPHLITKVENPYGRTATFKYDDQDRLTNVVDMIGLSSSFQYDTNDFLHTMVTPYGTTTFQMTENDDYSSSSNVVNRSLLVTQPDNSRHLYMYRLNSYELNETNSTPLIPSNYPTGDVPATSPFSNQFDNSLVNYRNSFHWGPQRYLQLNGSFRNDPTNFFLLTSNDYKLARMKHWLAAPALAPFTPGGSLGLLRHPSPDGGAEGRKVWYDYHGKSNPYYEGTNSRPSVIARVLPGGNSQFTHITRNEWQNPTEIVSTFSAGTTNVLFRTNTFFHKSNGIDLEYVTQSPGNEVIAGFGDYLDHLPKRITNALGETTFLTYDTTTRQITSIKHPGGLLTTNRYFTSGDHKNWLDKSIDLDIDGSTDVTNRFTYDKGVLKTFTGPRDLTVTLSWDALERLTNVVVPNGTFKLKYDKLDLVQLTDRMNFTNRWEYDSLRRLKKSIDPLNRTNVFTYCDCGALESITDPLLRVTSFFYDFNGRLTNVIYPGNIDFDYHYDGAGRLTNITDNADNKTTNWFSNHGLLIASSNAFGRVSLVVHDHEGNATNLVTSEGVTVTNSFDAAGRLLKRAWPANNNANETFQYSALGLTNYVDQLNNKTRFQYDLLARLTNRVHLDASSTPVETNRFEYSTTGDLKRLYDGRGKLTQWNYDQYGQVTNKVGDDSVVQWIYKYDANGRVTNRTDAATATTKYTYDKVGNLTFVDYPATSDITFDYDDLNRLTNVYSADVHVGTTRFTYHTNGRLASEDGPWAEDTVSFDYNTRGLLASLAIAQPYASSLVQSFGYDAANRLTNATSWAGSFGYAYHPGLGSLTTASRLTRKLSLPTGGYITNIFDPLGRLTETTLKNAAHNALNLHGYGYNLGNQRTDQTFLDTNQMAYTYDALGQLKTAQGTDPTSPSTRRHEQFTYSYDSGGNLEKRISNQLTNTFKVNRLNQLTNAARDGTITVAGISEEATGVTVNGAAAEQYDDGTFARTNLTLNTGNTVFTAIASDGYGRSATNQITVTMPPSVNFTNDAKGNLTDDGRRTFVYDDENQLIQVTVAGSTQTKFAYDGLGRRRVRTELLWQGGVWVTNSVTRYVYAGLLVVQERDVNNVPLVAYTRGPDLSGTLQEAGGIGGLLARTDQSQQPHTHAFYHADGSGNVTALLDGNGRIAARYSYDPFGNVLAMAGPLAEANLYRFSSKEAHPVSGLVYYLYRYYDPNMQRWIHRDPLGEYGGLNLYGYVGNNPIMFFDPYGLSFWGDFGNGLNNTVSGIGQAMGQGLYDLCQWQWSQDEYNRIGDLMYSLDTPENPAATPYVAGALGVSGAAATVAGGAGCWSAAQLPTMSIGWASPGGSTHFFWSVTTREGTVVLHSVGTSSMTGGIWAGYLGGSNAITGIPILFPGAAAATGVVGYNCFTGACGAVRRGIIGF